MLDRTTTIVLFIVRQCPLRPVWVRVCAAQSIKMWTAKAIWKEISRRQRRLWTIAKQFCNVTSKGHKVRLYIMWGLLYDFICRGCWLGCDSLPIETNIFPVELLTRYLIIINGYFLAFLWETLNIPAIDIDCNACSCSMSIVKHRRFASFLRPYCSNLRIPLFYLPSKWHHLIITNWATLSGHRTDMIWNCNADAKRRRINNIARKRNKAVIYNNVLIS